MNDNDKLFIVALCFILIPLLLGNKLKSLIAENFPDLLFSLGYAFIIALMFALVYIFALRNSKESFFFEVSKCNPKCSGGYYGKPATFQFTPLSVNGTTCPDQNDGYGMISACKYPECEPVLQKYGGANDMNIL